MSRFHLASLLLILLSLTACGSSDVAWHGRNIRGVLPDLAFTLADDGANVVTADKFTGKVVMLYFGFTHCEDVCPTTLNTLSTAVSRLGRDADRVRILFISIDPQRDTPAVLRRYAQRFAPQVVALSGSASQLAGVTRRYRAAYNYGEPDADGEYEVYHSSAIYVFDAHGKVCLLLEEKLGAAAIADDLRHLIDSPN